MGIQKESNAYLATLVQQEAITQDEFKDIAYKPEINAFHSKYLSSHYVDNVNWGWNAWQAAKADVMPEISNKIVIGTQVKIINPDDTIEYGVVSGDEGVVVWVGEFGTVFGVCIPKKGDVWSFVSNQLEITSNFAVPEGFVLVEKKNTESWYLDEYEGMYTDEPDNFLHDLEIGSVQAVKRKDYLIINEQTLYAACPWNKNDETADCWKFYESKAEADLVAENCIKNWNDGDSQEPNHD